MSKKPNHRRSPGCCGDKIIVLPSSGPHSNGYSLSQDHRHHQCRFIERLWWFSLAAALMAPTEITTNHCWHCSASCGLALAHITGGGLLNIEFLPEGCSASIDKQSWALPPVFKCYKRAAILPNPRCIARSIVSAWSLFWRLQRLMRPCSCSKSTASRLGDRRDRDGDRQVDMGL